MKGPIKMIIIENKNDIAKFYSMVKQGDEIYIWLGCYNDRKIKELMNDYGIDINDYKITYSTVKGNESVSDLVNELSTERIILMTADENFLNDNERELRVISNRVIFVKCDSSKASDKTKKMITIK